MSNENSKLTIAVFGGDGIGPELTAPCVALLDELMTALDGPGLVFEDLTAGAGHYQETGEALPQASLDRPADDRAGGVLASEPLLRGSTGSGH